MAFFPTIEIDQDFKDFLDENHVYHQYMDEDELHLLKFLIVKIRNFIALAMNV